MERGYIYEISTDAEDLFLMDESDFFGRLDTMPAAYVSNAVDPDKRAEDFLATLKKYGASVSTEDTNRQFAVDKSFKKKWFAGRFHEFKKAVSELSLEDFAESDPYTIRYLLHNTYGDAVYYNDCFHTLDYFIREILKPDETYYVGNVILMH